MPCLEIDPNFILPTHKRPLNDFLPEIGEDQLVTKLQGIAFLGRIRRMNRFTSISLLMRLDDYLDRLPCRQTPV